MRNERIGRFGHHPDPAIDFCVEVEAIEGEAININIGFTNGTPSRSELMERVERALTFRVGGDLNCVDAKQKLREISVALTQAAEQQEPVAWTVKGNLPANVEGFSDHKTGLVFDYANDRWANADTPLYTSPPVACPEPVDAILRNIRRAIMEDTTALNDTLWMPEDVFKGGTVIDYIDHALSARPSPQCDRTEAVEERDNEINALRTLISDLEKSRDEAREAASLGCDANRGGAHSIITQGSYKFCGGCGHTIKTPTLTERARKAEARVVELENRHILALIPQKDKADDLAKLRHKCATSEYHAHDGCTCSDAELLTRATTPTAKSELVEALRRLVTTYKDFEDGDGEPCPDVAFAAAALSNIWEE